MDLSDKFSAIQSAQKSGTAGAMDATKMAAFYKALPIINDLNQGGKGALADVAGGANFRAGRWAVSVNNFTSVGGTPFVDVTNIGLGTVNGAGGTGVSFAGANTGAPAAANQTAATTIANSITASMLTNLNNLTNGALAAAGITTPTQLGNALVNFAATNGASAAQITDAATTISQNASAAAPLIQSGSQGNAYTNNKSAMTVRGASLTEVAFGHGRQVYPGVFLGGNLKVIFGSVGYTRFNVLQNGSNTAIKDMRDNAEKSVQPAVDLGAMWKVNQTFPNAKFNPRVGLVFRNVNNPGFNEPSIATTNGEPSKFHENGQLRMGLAVSPFHFWNLAFDCDLTKNNTLVQGYQSRLMGLGTEVNVFNRTWINIPLRAGLMKNVADSESKLAYTGGFGVHLVHFMFDVGASVSADRTQIKDNKKVPSSLGLAAQLGMMF